MMIEGIVSFIPRARSRSACLLKLRLLERETRQCHKTPRYRKDRYIPGNIQPGSHNGSLGAAVRSFWPMALSIS